MAEVWSGRKRWGFLGLPWTFTKYTLLEDKFLVDSGFFSKKEEEIRLYRFMDLSLSRGFFQRMFGLGTITCVTADKTCPTLVIKNIKKSREVKEQLSDLIEKEREKKRVSSREFMSGNHYDIDSDGDFDDDDYHH